MVCASIQVHLRSEGKCMIQSIKIALILSFEIHKWKLKYAIIFLSVKVPHEAQTLLVYIIIFRNSIICGQLLHTAGQTPFSACSGDFIGQFPGTSRFVSKLLLTLATSAPPGPRQNMELPWDESPVLMGLVLRAGIAAFRSTGSLWKQMVEWWLGRWSASVTFF